MTKKILAALTALTMCAALAGCGNKSEGNGNSSAAGTSSLAANSPAAESEDGAEGSAADADNSGSNGEKNGDVSSEASGGNVTFNIPDTQLVGGNIIVMDEFEVGELPTDEELAEMIAAAVKQYKAAQARDMKAFIESFNFGIAKRPMTEMSDLAMSVDTDEDFDVQIAGQEVRYEVLDDIADLLEELGDESIMDEIYAYEGGGDAGDLISRLIDSVSYDKNYTEDELFYTIWDCEMVPLGEESDHTTYAMLPLKFQRYGDETYIVFELMIIDGGYEYYLDGVSVWCIDGEYGAYIDYASYFESEESIGMTPAEVYTQLMEEFEAY